jgi:hypothetical protein
LRDQVEVLSAQAQQAAKSEQALARLKERVAQLSEVAQQAQELERANAVLLQRSLAAEDAARHVPRLSRELDAAKEAFSEAQLALGRALAVGEERAARERALRDEVELLRCTENESMRDAALARELSAAAGASGAAETGAAGQPGLGLGLSELNPAVRERLQQLESDNVRMRAQLESLSEANLARLEVENDGLQRLATKVQAQLRDSEQRGAALEMPRARAPRPTHNSRRSICGAPRRVPRQRRGSQSTRPRRAWRRQRRRLRTRSSAPSSLWWASVSARRTRRAWPRSSLHTRTGTRPWRPSSRTAARRSRRKPQRAWVSSAASSRRPTPPTPRS